MATEQRYHFQISRQWCHHKQPGHQELPFNPSSIDPVYKQDLNLVITVPADALTPIMTGHQQTQCWSQFGFVFVKVSLDSQIFVQTSFDQMSLFKILRKLWALAVKNLQKWQSICQWHPCMVIQSHFLWNILSMSTKWYPWQGIVVNNISLLLSVSDCCGHMVSPPRRNAHVHLVGYPISWPVPTTWPTVKILLLCGW